MKNYSTLLFCTFLLIATKSIAQQIHGTVKDKNNTPVIGANIYWQNTTIGTTSDNNGDFVLEKSNLNFPTKLVISYVGYQNDTVTVNSKDESVSITLNQSKQLKEIQIEERDSSEVT